MTLDEAVTLHKEALSSDLVGHPDWRLSNSLGNRLFTRFKLRGNDQDLDEAMRFSGKFVRSVTHIDSCHYITLEFNSIPASSTEARTKTWMWLSRFS
jgi:hypothetical protein